MQRSDSGQPRVPIPVGVSRCLLGEPVRYDASHKRNRFITESLERYFTYVPLCPEVEAGLGVPREPIRLVWVEGALRVRGVRHRDVDVTSLLEAYAERVDSTLGALSGLILKSKSPSCGMERVKVYQPNGELAGFSASGLFAGAVMARYPLLPLEEEGRLNDPVLREGFVCRVFAYHRWCQLHAAGLTRRDLLDFHAEHKLLLMAHDEQRMRALGRLLAGLTQTSLEAAAEHYIGEFMAALAQPATRGRHVNVLTHLFGYLKRDLAPSDKEEVLEVIEHYRLGMVPLIVPVTLLRHHFRRLPVAYVERQRYLYWSPPELGLHNAV